MTAGLFAYLIDHTDFESEGVVSYHRWIDELLQPELTGFVGRLASLDEWTRHAGAALIEADRNGAWTQLAHDATKDPPWVWRGHAGPPAELALNYARERRTELIWQLQRLSPALVKGIDAFHLNGPALPIPNAAILANPLKLWKEFGAARQQVPTLTEWAMLEDRSDRSRLRMEGPYLRRPSHRTPNEEDGTASTKTSNRRSKLASDVEDVVRQHDGWLRQRLEDWFQLSEHDRRRYTLHGDPLNPHQQRDMIEALAAWQVLSFYVAEFPEHRAAWFEGTTGPDIFDDDPPPSLRRWLKVVGKAVTCDTSEVTESSRESPSPVTDAEDLAVGSVIWTPTGPDPAIPTAGDLVAKAEISIATLDRIRTAAGIKVKLRGGAARNRPYPPPEVDRLIAAVLAGRFIKRSVIALKWTMWSSKAAKRGADKPQEGLKQASSFK